MVQPESEPDFSRHPTTLAVSCCQVLRASLTMSLMMDSGLHALAQPGRCIPGRVGPRKLGQHLAEVGTGGREGVLKAGRAVCLQKVSAWQLVPAALDIAQVDQAVLAQVVAALPRSRTGRRT